MRAAAVAWELSASPSFDRFSERVRAQVGEAAGSLCDVVVFPENFTLELLDPTGSWSEADVPAILSEHAESFRALLQGLATEFGCNIVGGTCFERGNSGIQNVCVSVSSDGSMRSYAKNRLTQYELNVWRLVHGSAIAPPKGNLASLICYDSEFPEACRPLAEAGMTVLAVPYNTETEFGHQRVLLSGHARAIENQIFVVQAALLGSIGREPVTSTVGRSSILAPCIEPFAATGVLAQTDVGVPGFAIADLDLTKLETCRQNGDVRNWNDRHGAWTLGSE